MMTGDTPPEDYQGFPRERFSTFAIESTTLDDFEGRRVPVFVARGTLDRNSAPENTDATVVELLRRDREHVIHYLILDGLDHAFRDRLGEGHAEEVLARFVDWAARGPSERNVETVSFAAPVQMQDTIRVLGLPPWLLALFSFGIGTVALSRPASRQQTRARRARTGIGVVAITVGATTLGLWWGVVSGVRESLPHALCGTLAGLLGLCATRCIKR